MPEIVLKDKSGNPKGYSNVETIAVKDSDNNTVEYNRLSTSKLVVTQNDTYTAPSGVAYNEVEVNVPNPSVGTLDIYENDYYDVTEYAEVKVMVPTINANDKGKVVAAVGPVAYLVDQTTSTIRENGTYDTTTIKSITVDVGGDPALPSEYQEVEYLDNDGDCWCTINYTPLYSDYVEIEIALLTTTPAAEGGIVGNSDSPNWDIYSKNSSIMFYGSSFTGTQIDNVQPEVKYTAKGHFGYKTSDYRNYFYWGRYKTNSYPFIGRMYSCRIFAERGSVQINGVKLVPCRRKSDSVLGFYDLINSVFYVNQGTGTFTAGPDIN